MNVGWQEAVVGLVVVLAGVYLIRRAWRVMFGKGRAGCSACSSCKPQQSHTGDEERPFVTIESLSQSARKEYD